MDEGSKQRLVGAAVLIGLAVIFVPMLFEEREPIEESDHIEIPERPDFDAVYQDSLDANPVSPSNPPAILQNPVAEGPLALPLPERPSPISTGNTAADAASQVPVSRSEPPVPAQSSAAAPGNPSVLASEPSVRQDARPSVSQTQTAPSKPAAPAETTISGWVVQVASLSERDKAEELRDELRREGYKVFVETARVGGKDYYRVRIGPEASRSRAESLSQRLSKETRYQPLVQSYP